MRIDAELRRWGWYPAGSGEIPCKLGADRAASRFNPINVDERGPLRQVAGTAVAANLPAHIPQPMADRARASLGDLGVSINIVPRRVTAARPGAGIFLSLSTRAWRQASGYGRLGKPSKGVADEPVVALREHHVSGGAVELPLADQLLLLLSFAAGISTFTTRRPTNHLLTNAWVLGQFAVADISIEQGTSCRVRIEPRRRL